MWAREYVCKRTHIRRYIGFTIFCSSSWDRLRPRPSIILPSSSMSMWPLLIPRCHLARRQQTNEQKAGKSFRISDLRSSSKSSNIPLRSLISSSLRIVCGSMTSLSSTAFFLRIQCQKTRWRTSERTNKKLEVCTNQIKERTQFDCRKHASMRLTYTHTCFPSLSLCSWLPHGCDESPMDATNQKKKF